MKYNLDDKNRQILDILQQDAKLSVKEIASRIQLSFTPTYERIKNMEEAGIISKYVALVDRQRVGLKVAAYCNVTLKEQSKFALLKFEDAIKDIPEIIETISVSGNYDYMLKIVSTDIESYNKFIIDTISNLSNIGQYHSSIVMTEVKKETAFKIPHPEELY
ncbi:Lrp/AsnC family transcriptional regulator [Elizabethkingia anophelis]|uniref:Lrp/AsnC family transcriptional regulator n=1 Tax=Elizabethkingia anophelis TaxID=1117645 RepID=UPI000999A147|nr:Lrp/AsnC family transcriptional regulator [Elizabethkingia anophelis]MDV4130018.1 Lrp/AsnC family transcriptional regulator [Elizabethkingia anophelis]MDV4135547.1 Lrp/AsnC family transcriptional regulator [Elizabethkingia anophelis]OPC60975.1 AsnC family transcriptional regulator [Elizabethkingia anophelis]